MKTAFAFNLGGWNNEAIAKSAKSKVVGVPFVWITSDYP